MTDPVIGTLVAGRFLVERELGRGGMGVVYRAIQRSVDRPIALKVLPAEYTGAEARIARFEREAKVTASLRSPHTVTVHDFGRLEDGSLFIAMELLEGRSLQKILDAERVIEPRRAAAIAEQICSSLEEAHAKGLVHRDLKPANVMIEVRGNVEHVKVLDFGIAKVIGDAGPAITRAGTIFGTPQYMSPEQCSGAGDRVGPRADLYALGVIIFQMISGKLPFDSENVIELLLAQAREPPPKIAGGVLQGVLDRALAKDPGARFADAAEMRAALRDAFAAPHVEPRVEPRRRTKRQSIAIAVALGAAMAIAGAALLPKRRGAPPEPEPVARAVKSATVATVATVAAVEPPDSPPPPPPPLPAKKISKPAAPPQRLISVVPESQRATISGALAPLSLSSCRAPGHRAFVTVGRDGHITAIAVRPDGEAATRARSCLEPILQKASFAALDAAFATFQLEL